MTAPTRVLEFRPVALHLQRVGPFQEGPLTVAFTDPEGEPCNLFILLSENGRGKTTILESLAYLASLLAPDGTPEAEPPRWLADHPEARLQLDLRVKTELDGRRSTVVLSLLAGHGEDPGLAAWTSEQLAALGASDWVRYGYGRTRQGVVRRIGQRGEIAGALRAFVAAARSRPPQGFEDEPTEEAPTVLYSPSDRNLVPPPPAHERARSAPLPGPPRGAPFRTGGRRLG